MDFAERYKSGTDAERLVIPELEARGWNVEPGPRYFWSPGLSRVLTDWRDHHGPNFLRWSPDFMVWQREPRAPSNFYAIDAKTTQKTGEFPSGFNIERNALETYIKYAEHFNTPVVLVYVFGDELYAASAGKALINSIPKFGVGPERTPYYEIDFTKLSPMERFFGEKPSGVKP